MSSLSEVRRVRHEMSKAASHDVRRLIALINTSRDKASSRIISPGLAAETTAPVEAATPLRGR
jgi:hypothetical protein